VLCYEEGSAISRPSLGSGPSILYFKTGNINKTITNPLKHVANCRVTSHTTLAAALDYMIATCKTCKSDGLYDQEREPKHVRLLPIPLSSRKGAKTTGIH
jgi:hypothetical protein